MLQATMVRFMHVPICSAYSTCIFSLCQSLSVFHLYSVSWSKSLLCCWTLPKNQNTPSLFTVSFLRMRWRSFVTKLTWHERLPIKVSSITLLQHRSFCVHPCVIKWSNKYQQKFYKTTKDCSSCGRPSSMRGRWDTSYYDLVLFSFEGCGNNFKRVSPHHRQDSMSFKVSLLEKCWTISFSLVFPPANCIPFSLLVFDEVKCLNHG